MFEALIRLMLRSFRNWQDSNIKESYNNISYEASKLAATFGANGPDCKEKRQIALQRFKENLDKFSSDLKEYLDEKQSNPTFTFRKEYIDMIHYSYSSFEQNVMVTGC